jgi:hypothetical protein
MLKNIRPSSNVIRPVKKLGGGCVVLFGLPFIAVGLAVAWFLYLPVIGGWWSARGWEEVPCWIEKAEMTTGSGKSGPTYETKAVYRYEYRGRTHRSETVGFMSGADNVDDFQPRSYEQIRPFEGQERPFRCYVNPAHPEQAVLFRDLRWGLVLLMSIFPMVFPLAGAAVSLGGWLQTWRIRQQGRLQERHPHEPWLWRKEWQGDTIRASAGRVPFILAIAGWILLVQGPLALAIVIDGELLRSPLAALGLLPCLLALIPLFMAWKRLKTRLALGSPGLRLNQVPVTPGREMEGELKLSKVLSPRTTIHVRALCQRKIVRSTGKGTSTSTETLWEHRETLSASEAWRDIHGVALPLRIAIPRGLPCQTVEEAEVAPVYGEQHVWSLELASGEGGKPVVLPLPVFVTREEAKLAESEALQPLEVVETDTEQLVQRLRLRHVTARFDDSGIPTWIDCPPRRFRSLGIFLLLFAIFWSAAFVVMINQEAPWIFRIVWGISSPGLLIAAFWTLLHRRVVELGSDQLRIEHHIGPFYSWSETFEPRHIVRFTHDSNMQSGNVFYYRVRAETTFGKTKTLLDGVTESATAETVARRLEAWQKRG